MGWTLTSLAREVRVHGGGTGCGAYKPGRATYQSQGVERRQPGRATSNTKVPVSLTVSWWNSVILNGKKNIYTYRKKKHFPNRISSNKIESHVGETRKSAREIKHDIQVRENTHLHTHHGRKTPYTSIHTPHTNTTQTHTTTTTSDRHKIKQDKTLYLHTHTLHQITNT